MVVDFFGTFISHSIAKMKLAILAFLYCGEFLKTSIRR